MLLPPCFMPELLPRRIHELSIDHARKSSRVDFVDKCAKFAWILRKICANFVGLCMDIIPSRASRASANHRTFAATVLYIENFKNLLVRNHWTTFNIILQKCSFGDPLPRLFKPFGFVKKHGCQGRGLFSLYIYIENFKNLLVRNHWTDFNITLQKCFLGDPLLRLFK